MSILEEEGDQVTGQDSIMTPIPCLSQALPCHIVAFVLIRVITRAEIGVRGGDYFIRLHTPFPIVGVVR